jgi:hypothetical protein
MIHFVLGLEIGFFKGIFNVTFSTSNFSTNMSRFLQLLQDCPKCSGTFPIEERECVHCEVDKLLKEVMDVGLQVPHSTSKRKRERKSRRDFHWTLKSLKAHSEP